MVSVTPRTPSSIGTSGTSGWSLGLGLCWCISPRASSAGRGAQQLCGSSASSSSLFQEHRGHHIHSVSMGGVGGRRVLQGESPSLGCRLFGASQPVPAAG